MVGLFLLCVFQDNWVLLPVSYSADVLPLLLKMSWKDILHL